jgi:hypothetical protein
LYLHIYRLAGMDNILQVVETNGNYGNSILLRHNAANLFNKRILIK